MILLLQVPSAAVLWAIAESESESAHDPGFAAPGIDSDGAGACAACNAAKSSFHVSQQGSNMMVLWRCTSNVPVVLIPSRLLVGRRPISLRQLTHMFSP